MEKVANNRDSITVTVCNDRHCGRYEGACEPVCSVPMVIDESETLGRWRVPSGTREEGLLLRGKNQGYGKDGRV